MYSFSGNLSCFSVRSYDIDEKTVSVRVRYIVSVLVRSLAIMCCAVFSIYTVSPRTYWFTNILSRRNMLSTNSLAKNIVSERAERLFLSETAEVCVRQEASSRAEIAIRIKCFIGRRIRLWHRSRGRPLRRSRGARIWLRPSCSNNHNSLRSSKRFNHPLIKRFLVYFNNSASVAFRPIFFS